MSCRTMSGSSKMSYIVSKVSQARWHVLGTGFVLLSYPRHSGVGLCLESQLCSGLVHLPEEPRLLNGLCNTAPLPRAPPAPAASLSQLPLA